MAKGTRSGENFSGFNIIEFSGQSAEPKIEYHDPAVCRICNCKLNRYNPLDICYPCQDNGKIGHSRTPSKG